MTQILNDIKTKTHDKKACIANCTENGKIFNHVPYQCRYFTSSPRYKNLLDFLELKSVESSKGGKSSAIQNPQMNDFFVQLILLEDYEVEINSGIRQQDDTISVVDSIDNL